MGSLMVVFNTKRKPFDDIRVRQALSMALDRWGGSPSLAKISILKHVGGFMRPGFSMALPRPSSPSCRASPKTSRPRACRPGSC